MLLSASVLTVVEAGIAILKVTKAEDAKLKWSVQSGARFHNLPRRMNFPP